jgi:hypothetical protein
MTSVKSKCPAHQIARPPRHKIIDVVHQLIGLLLLRLIRRSTV